MPTHAELSVRLLTEAATFFRTLGDKNEMVHEQMVQNASIFDQVAGLLTSEPLGRVEGKTYAQMGTKLLRDAAAFFRMLGEQNEPLKAQMTQNAAMYEQVATLLEKNPAGTLG